MSNRRGTLHPGRKSSRRLLAEADQSSSCSADYPIAADVAPLGNLSSALSRASRDNMNGLPGLRWVHLARWRDLHGAFDGPPSRWAMQPSLALAVVNGCRRTSTHYLHLRHASWEYHDSILRREPSEARRRASVSLDVELSGTHTLRSSALVISVESRPVIHARNCARQQTSRLLRMGGHDPGIYTRWSNSGMLW